MNNTKVVLYPNIARKLLKLGYQIVDVKPKKENRSGTLFIFKVEDGFEEEFNKLMKEFHSEKRK